MSVLIKGMEMPKCCAECVAGAYEYNENDERCFVCGFIKSQHPWECEHVEIDGIDTTKARADFCPLIEIPTPHGRLIDADAFKNYIRSGYEEMKHLFNENLKVATLVTESFCKDIDEQPTIQPEPHWIPVTEATPTEDDDYWATFEAETGRFVDWASWYQGRWVVWIEGSPAHLSNAIAWCKPMEPYKGVTE